MTIHKDDLIKKYVEFIDSCGAFRIGKVIRMQKGTLTIGKGKHMERKKGIILTVLYGKGIRERVLSDKVNYWVHRGRGRDIKEHIIWDDKKEKDEDIKKARKPRKPREIKKKEEPKEEKKIEPNIEVKKVFPAEKQKEVATKQTTLFAKGMVMME